MASHRIALLHYTGGDSVGGVEQILNAQGQTLTDAGHEVQLIAGKATVPSWGGYTRIPLLHPDHPRIMSARLALARPIPELDHPLVTFLYRSLSRTLKSYSQCWVHNAFTMYVNPFLSVAIHQLAHDLSSIRWVAWCHDVSATSRFWQDFSSVERDVVCRPNPRITYATISQHRRTELATLLSVAVETIRVVAPPVDATRWLSLGKQTIFIRAAIRLDDAEPLVLVPSKVLPHKNLPLVVDVAAALARHQPKARFLITGAPSPHESKLSAETRQAISQLCRDRDLEHIVQFLPDICREVVTIETVRELMMLADLVFLPSVEEGFGIPIREAALLRCPILCSDIPAFREAGADCAHYFSLDSSSKRIAAQIEDLTLLPLNRLRRITLRSRREFSQAMKEIAGNEHCVSPPSPQAYVSP